MSSSEFKIIIIGPAYPYRGGNSLFISYLFDALRKYYNIKIYNYKLLYPSFLFPGTTQLDESKTYIKKAPSDRVVNSISPFNWINVAAMLKKENADLIIFDWWHPFFAFCHFSISFLVKRKYKGKILFITENVISHESHLADRILTKIGLKNADKFLVLSEKVEKNLASIFPRKKIYRSELPIYDCYRGNNAEPENVLKKNLGFKEDDCILLFFGYVRKYKGLDILLEAIPELIKFDSHIRLLVVGEFYEDKKNYDDLIKSFKIKDYVRIINKFIPNEEVYKYFEVSELVVLPYKSATQSGILNVAYGFLKPAVVTDVGGLAEFVLDGKTGIIIKPDSIDEIVNGIKKYFALKSTVNFTENIHNFIEDNSFNNLPELLNKILNENLNDIKN